MHKRFLIIVLGLFLSLAAVRCGASPPAAPAESGAAEEPAAGVEESAETAADAAPEAIVATPDELRIAAIFPGVITDADYNTLGFLGIETVRDELGLEIAYSEQVAVPDVERVMREYIDDGFNVIFTHGGQFLSQTTTLAEEFPEVYFIGESDAAPENAPANLWVIDRNFQVGFYPLGVIAAKQSQTGKIGYIGGLTLPFSYAEVHAMEQAIADNGLAVELIPVWAGDFNDPTKARELAEAMIGGGVDVIIGSLNLGTLGLFEAAKNSETPVWIIAKYTDKSEFAPEHYVTSVIYDFAGPLKEIIGKIEAGQTGGYYPLGFDTGVVIQPLQNASPELAEEAQQLSADVAAGTIKVMKDTTPIE